MCVCVCVLQLQLPVAEWEGLMSHDPFAFKLLLLNSIQQNPKGVPPHSAIFLNASFIEFEFDAINPRTLF